MLPDLSLSKEMLGPSHGLQANHCQAVDKGYGSDVSRAALREPGIKADLCTGWHRVAPRVYVLGKLTGYQDLVKVIAYDAALALVRHFSKEETGGGEIDLPLGPTGVFGQYRRREGAVREGGTEQDIARRIGVTGRTVWRERRQQRQDPDPNQGELF